MAKLCFTFMLLVVVAAAAHMATAARDVPKKETIVPKNGNKNGLSDQKNIINYGGIGTYSGIGNNGLPFGGIGGGMGSAGSLGGATGLGGVGGGVGLGGGGGLPGVGGFPAIGGGGGVGGLPTVGGGVGVGGNPAGNLPFP